MRIAANQLRILHRALVHRPFEGVHRFALGDPELKAAGLTGSARRCRGSAPWWCATPKRAAASIYAVLRSTPKTCGLDALQRSE